MVRSPLRSAEKNPERPFAHLLRERVTTVGMLPSVATEALELMRDPDCSIAEFAHIVERDVNLALEVLRVANSSVYGFDKPVTSFEEAVFRLGFRQCKNLILASCFSTLMRDVDLEEEWIRDVLWKHSYLTGMLSVHLNRTLKLGFFGEEFTAGLLHDFGRILLAVLLPNEFAKIDPLDFDESIDVIQREAEMVGTNHAELGAWYVMDNGLPADLADAVRYHHAPDAATVNRALVAVVAVADQLANQLQRDVEPSDFDIATTPAIEVLAAEINPAIRARFLDVAPSIMEIAYSDAEKMTLG